MCIRVKIILQGVADTAVHFRDVCRPYDQLTQILSNDIIVLTGSPPLYAVGVAAATHFGLAACGRHRGRLAIHETGDSGRAVGQRRAVVGLVAAAGGHYQRIRQNLQHCFTNNKESHIIIAIFR